MAEREPHGSVEEALAQGRPLDALSGLPGDDPRGLRGEALELWCRAQLAAGRAAAVRQLCQRQAEALPAEDARRLKLYGALALWQDPEAPRALVLDELLPLADEVEGEGAALLFETVAAVYLACGAPEQARQALARSASATSSSPHRKAAALALGLATGCHAALDTDPTGLTPAARAGLAAARGDRDELGREVEAWDLDSVQRRTDLEDLARYGEALGRPAWTRVALERLGEAGLEGEELSRRRYRLALARWRLGDREAAAELLERISAPSGLVGPAAAELLETLRAGSADSAETSVTRLPPLGAWPGVPACVAAVVRALRWLGRDDEPFGFLAGVKLDGADVASAGELLDGLKELGVNAVQVEADAASLVRVLEADLPTVLRLVAPGRAPTWGLVAGFDAPRRLFRLLLPGTGEILELPVRRLARLQEPVGFAALVLGRPGAPAPGELGLKTSMALEALDQAARKARAGRLAEALERLERARAYRVDLLPVWMLLTEFQVISTLNGTQGTPEELTAFLDEAEAAWPTMSWPALFRARFLLETDRKDEAYQVLLQAVRKETVEAEVWTELGDLEEERERPEEAARAWWCAHRINPLYPRPREQLSRHFRRQKRREMALALCETALETSPRNPYNWEMLGILLGEGGGDPERIEGALRQAMVLNPQRPYAYGFLCDLYLREGELERALDVLEEGARSGADPYPYLLRSAELRFDDQDYEGSIEAAERALQVREGEPVPLALIGASHGRRGDVDRAVDILGRAIELDRTDPWPVRELAIHLRGAGRTDEALTILEEGGRHCPDDVGIRAQRALTYEADGDFARGLEAAREALEMAGPDEFEVVRLTARMASSAGQLPVAEAVWRAAVAASSNPSEARKQFLSFLLDVEAFDLAEREARVALGHCPGDEELCAWNGYSLVRLGRYEDAIPWLRRALEAAPDYPFARSVLLDALTEIGDDKGAIESYLAGSSRLTPLGYECAFVAYARLGSFRDALCVARKATMAVPHTAGFFHRRAARMLLDDLFQFDEALAEAESAVECDPDDSRTHEVHAWALAALRRFEEAEAAMDRMVEGGAGLEELLRFRRYLASRRGDHEGEESCARELARLLAEDERQVRYWSREAAALSLRRDPSGAAAAAHLEGVSPTPGDWAALAVQAGLLGLGALCAGFLEKAGRGGSPDAQVARGYMRDWEDDLPGALEAYATLCGGHPEDHRGPEMQARMLLVAGRIDEALPLAQRAHEMAGSFCQNARFVWAAARLLAGDAEAARVGFQHADQLAGREGPSLLRVMGLWAAGHAGEAEDELAAVLRWPRTLPLDRRLARRLAGAAGLHLGE